MEQESIKEVISRIVSFPVFKNQKQAEENKSAGERWTEQWFGKAYAAKKKKKTEAAYSERGCLTDNQQMFASRSVTDSDCSVSKFLDKKIFELD